MHGFQNIILIGDSGGNQAGMKAVAEKLNADWNGSPVVAQYRRGHQESHRQQGKDDTTLILELANW